MGEIIQFDAGRALLQYEPDFTDSAAAAAAWEATEARSEYMDGKATKTLQAYKSDLATFVEFLKNDPKGTQLTVDHLSGDLTGDLRHWRTINSGLLRLFKRYLLERGFALSTINRKLASLRIYAQLAFREGVIDEAAYTKIALVRGYSRKDKPNVDAKRDEIGLKTRVDRPGAKKAETTEITLEQAIQLLRNQPDTAQGRRDAVILGLMIDLGLRCGEIALLDVSAVDLKRRTITFLRPKVDKTKPQIMRLEDGVYEALRRYADAGEMPAAGRLLRKTEWAGGRKAKARADDQAVRPGSPGMTERAINKRVGVLGKQIGIEKLSPHDLRHFCLNDAAEMGSPEQALLQLGGWSSRAMLDTYIRRHEIANEKVKRSKR